MLILTGPLARMLRPDLAAIPPEGVEPSHVVLALRADDQNPLGAARRVELAGQAA